ncbi:MAG: hypothetical protein MZV49_07020 [Rhodopseudomonas palustris]|nr:hypothetical protein [Rhodopseudomonas palustris]
MPTIPEPPTPIAAETSGPSRPMRMKLGQDAAGGRQVVAKLLADTLADDVPEAEPVPPCRR